MPLLDILKVRFPGIVEGVVFTSKTKERMVLNTRNLMEGGILEIPKNEKLIEQLHGIEKTVLESGRIKYTGKRTETDWLDDRAWSLMIACSQLGDGGFEFKTIETGVGQKKRSAYDIWINDEWDD